MTRRAGSARARGAGGEVGMVRLFDLHAVSCAGDTLIAIGLAGTIFFNVPLGEARSKVALYLLVTMVPFAMLAPGGRARCSTTSGTAAGTRWPPPCSAGPSWPG